ncbi:hypothetical protein K8S19_06350 [bacterium]|nr:hypothetical protein [bacterium]
MLKKDAIHVMIIRLEMDKKINFSVLLSSDGSINRIGTGLKDNDDSTMYSGICREDLFLKILEYVPDAIFDKQGNYEVKDRKGRCCEMIFYFSNQAESETARFRFIYGSESMGPPLPFVQLFAHARQITDSWYLRQKKVSQTMAMKG